MYIDVYDMYITYIILSLNFIPINHRKIFRKTGFFFSSLNFTKNKKYETVNLIFFLIFFFFTA